MMTCTHFLAVLIFLQFYLPHNGIHLSREFHCVIANMCNAFELKSTMTSKLLKYSVSATAVWVVGKGGYGWMWTWM